MKAHIKTLDICAQGLWLGHALPLNKPQIEAAIRGKAQEHGINVQHFIWTGGPTQMIAYRAAIHTAAFAQTNNLDPRGDQTQTFYEETRRNISPSLLYPGGLSSLLVNGSCILSEPPTWMSTDRDGNLHADDGPAVKWQDGSEMFFFHGVHVKHVSTAEPLHHRQRRKV